MAKKPAAPDTTAPFAGFGPRALPFFTDLAAHQDREWFQANRAVYERDVKAPLGALINDLAFAFAAHDIPLVGDARRSLFRIHRDVRFSKDKSPYKTHAGAVITRDGAKDADGLLYIQVGGETGSFMGLGFYGVEPKDLATLRTAIVERTARWEEVESELAEADLVLSGGNPQSRMPRGFEDQAGSPLAAVLKMRHLLVSRPISAERLAQPDLLGDIIDFAAAGLPLLRFGWSALDRARVSA